MKKWVESRQKFPPDPALGEVVVDTASTATSNGIETVTITRVPQEKVGEALLRAVNTMVLFQGIKGFEYSIRTYTTAEEGV
ncbi:MAG: hypothetical protein ACFFBZ_16000, partial [Promethearchaeota archaeon]